MVLLNESKVLQMFVYVDVYLCNYEYTVACYDQKLRKCNHS